jgi:putative methanogen marker protein 4
MPSLTIGIGSDERGEKVLEGALASGISSGITIYAAAGRPVSAAPAVTYQVSPEPAEKMIADLADGKIAAAVRGTLPANQTLSLLKRACGVESLLRAALLETHDGQKFLLAPVGVDEGWTVDQRIELANRARMLAAKCGLKTRVGILSGGRLGDTGRHPEVDRSLADAELVARMTGGEHYQILIEEAIRDCGVIIAPDGISGNLIFRTLVFLGSGRGHGAPVLNISRIFIDTSRATPDYANALRLAESLLKQASGEIH